ncbi:MAG: molecular chaperone TorD family protein [Actinobacteria bacterium]|nr:molecular chaperone TorD family protein [Actinomycetota bacterium]
MNEMCEMRFPTHTGNKNTDEGYRLLCTYLSNVWERTLTELAVDYTRVFIGHGINAFSAAYPYESVHTSARRLLMQGARDDVLALYRAAGITQNSSWKDAEDHLALELEFEQILAIRTLEALEQGDEDKAVSLLLEQYNFLQDHLINWVPMLAADMERFAKTDFYKALGLITLGFLETDCEFLEDILEEEIEKQDAGWVESEQIAS